MSKGRKDPRKGNAGDLGDWLANPKNREKMYRHDREAAAELERMREDERRNLSPSETSEKES